MLFFVVAVLICIKPQMQITLVGLFPKHLKCRTNQNPTLRGEKGKGVTIRVDSQWYCESRYPSQRSAYGRHNFHSWHVGQSPIFSRLKPCQSKNQSASNHWICLACDGSRVGIGVSWKCGWKSHLQVEGKDRRLVGRRQRLKCRVGL